jgi:Neutral/alkaline non-lysosomal ceramidase, N-terminal
MGTNLLAGAADADITPAIGTPMGGYGRREGVAEGTHAPLRCHAVVFDDGTTPVGLVVCDLLFVSRDLSALVRTLVGDALGWRPEQVMVAATHTHSGPSGLSLEQDAAYVTMVARQAAGALRAAFAGRAPARLKYAEAGVSSISQNRRDPGGPIETVARMLVADPITGGADRDVVATVVNYACHATVLEYDNLRYSPDFPGTVVDVLRSLVGGRAVYLQGCAGNINPVWMRHDQADARRVGTILGAAAARSVSEARPIGHGQWAVNLSWYEDTPKDVTGSREVPAGRIRAESATVALPRRARSSPSDLKRELADAAAAVDAAAADPDRRRALSPRKAALEAEFFFASYPGFYGDDDEPAGGGPADAVDEAEVQVLWLGDQTAIVGLPGEPFIEIAHEIRRRSGIANLIVAGYCNEAAGYIPTQAEFGRQGYEVGCAPYQPEAAGLLVDAALSALASAA